MDVPPLLIKWAASFLLLPKSTAVYYPSSTQCKMSSSRYTIFGPLAFVVHIIDLQVPVPELGFNFESIPRLQMPLMTQMDTTTQKCFDYMGQWTAYNMRNNIKKTKDVILFC